jgi:hypothetical protein
MLLERTSSLLLTWELDTASNLSWKKNLGQNSSKQVSSLKQQQAGVDLVLPLVPVSRMTSKRKNLMPLTQQPLLRRNTPLVFPFLETVKPHHGCKTLSIALCQSIFNSRDLTLYCNMENLEWQAFPPKKLPIWKELLTSIAASWKMNT